MIAALALAVGVAAAPAPLEYDLRWDVPITAGIGAWWLLSEFAFKEDLAPRDCKWCARNGLDDAGRTLRAGTLADQKRAALTSDVVGIALTPVVAFSLDAIFTWAGGGTWRDSVLDVLLIFEAVIAFQGLNQAVKFMAGRERPLASVLSPAEKRMTAEPEDNNLSFFSGHTGYAFAMISAAATVIRARGYEKWWVVLAVGMPIAVTTGVLRMVADKHYLTDVLTGALLGGLIGWGVPFFFHRPVRAAGITAWLSPGPGGLAVEGRW